MKKVVRQDGLFHFEGELAAELRAFEPKGRAELARHRAMEGAVVPEAGWRPETGCRGP